MPTLLTEPCLTVTIVISTIDGMKDRYLVLDVHGANGAPFVLGLPSTQT